jgi:amidase
MEIKDAREANRTPATDRGDICYLDAVELARRIRTGELSAGEAMAAHLERIDRTNPDVNAICTFLPEQAARGAGEADAALARGEAVGPLHGLPVAVKDLVDTKGIRTTMGSPIYKDRIPAQDALHVQRLKEAGAIIVGKTNVPEFGAGSQTFNPVFGATRNPYDLSKTCGGSSGGAAAALACGMVPVADGSDVGGSLRNPASFCNVVGFRPSPGRVPSWPSMLPWSTLGVDGPMARTVQDVALLLSVMAGQDPRSPIAIQQPGSAFAAPLERDFQGARVAWTPDLGRYPVEPEVVDVCEAALGVFSELGCRVEPATPDFSGADEIFQVLRAWSMARLLEADLRKHRSLMKDTVIWNVERGLGLSGLDVSEAEVKRGLLYHRVSAFLEEYQFLVLPVAQVVPFDVETEWVTDINGVVMETYIDWMASCYAITLTGLPAISVPCGFTPGGLPVGLQIVGRHQSDLEVLQIAYGFQQATRFSRSHPSL